MRTAQCVLPAQADEAWATVFAYLCARFPHIPAAVWQSRIEAGDVTLSITPGGRKYALPALCQHTTVTLTTPYVPQGKVLYRRSVAQEQSIPFRETILYEDEALLVVDKPHFLPVSPVGRYVAETLLTRLQAKLGLPELSLVHRLDRETAGLVLLTKQARHRAAYHALFRTRQVAKRYEALAPFRADLAFPLVRRSHLQSHPTVFMQMQEVPLSDAAGATVQPNAETEIRLLETDGKLARYALLPVTGQRHQLRVHMAALGMPILHDTIYPVLQPEQAVQDFAQPLQLLAKSLAFIDPLSGAAHAFESGLRLRSLAEALG